MIVLEDLIDEKARASVFYENIQKINDTGFFSKISREINLKNVERDIKNFIGKINDSLKNYSDARQVPISFYENVFRNNENIRDFEKELVNELKKGGYKVNYDKLSISKIYKEKGPTFGDCVAEQSKLITNLSNLNKILSFFNRLPISEDEKYNIGEKMKNQRNFLEKIIGGLTFYLEEVDYNKEGTGNDEIIKKIFYSVKDYGELSRKFEKEVAKFFEKFGYRTHYDGNFIERFEKNSKI